MGAPLRAVRPRLALAAAAAVLLLAGGAVAIRPLLDRSAGPAAIVPAPQGPFLGGRLPDDLDREPAPRIRLRTVGGDLVDSAALKGRPYLVTFVFTDCPDVCPAIGRTIAMAIGELGEGSSELEVLFVSVDPDGDSEASVDRWRERLGLPESVRYLVSPRRALEATWEDYFAAAQPEGDEASMHTASIWLIDRRGRLRTKFSAGFPVLPAELAHDLRLLLAES